MDDLTGFWRFSEEFEYGQKAGEARLFQNGEHLKGILVFKEWDQDENYIMVRCNVKGVVAGQRVFINDEHAVVLFGQSNDEYLCEKREGIINELEQIVGSTIDVEKVSGVFVMEKIR